jgi:hypothetical protein
MTTEAKKSKAAQITSIKPVEIHKIVGHCPLIEGPAILLWFKAFKETCDDYKIEDELSARARYLRVWLAPENHLRRHWPDELADNSDLDNFFSALLNAAFPPENLRSTLVADLVKPIAANFNHTVLDALLDTFLALDTGRTTEVDAAYP